jgi:hypothetical protein
LVAGSSPARGAKKNFLNKILKLFAAFKLYKIY